MAIARLSGVELSYEETGAGVPLVWSFNLHVAEFLATVERGRWAGWTASSVARG